MRGRQRTSTQTLKIEVVSAVRGTPSQVALIRLLVLLDPQTISAHPVQAPVLNPAAQTKSLLAFPVDGIHSLHLSHPHARLAPLVTFKTTPTPKNASLVSLTPVAQSKTLISADHVQGDSYAQVALQHQCRGNFKHSLCSQLKWGVQCPLWCNFKFCLRSIPTRIIFVLYGI